MSLRKKFHCVFVGGGPGGTGPLVAALQRGLLPRLLEQRLAVVERGRGLGSGTLGAYELRSDSMAGAFLECLEPAPAREVFGALAERPHVQELQRLRTTHAPLRLVARVLDDVGARLQREIEQAHGCEVLAQHEACELRAARDGGWNLSVLTPEGRVRTLASQSIVLALGGTQGLEETLTAELGPGLRLADRWRERVVLSDGLFSALGRARLRAQLAHAGPRARLVVLGGSHSAFSAVWTALEVASDLLGPGAITLAHRGRLRVFYPSPADAAADGYRDFGPTDVCPLTGRVHRLGGLRGDGRGLARRLLGLGGLAPEERVSLRDLDAERDPQRLAALLDEATCIVAAFGYRARTLPTWGADRQRLELGLPLQRRLVDDEGRVLDARGAIVPGLFGIGLASGYVPRGEQSFRGHTNGVWLYQNDTGERILRGIGVAA